jgi:hypothetical protein
MLVDYDLSMPPQYHSQKTFVDSKLPIKKRNSIYNKSFGNLVELKENGQHFPRIDLADFLTSKAANSSYQFTLLSVNNSLFCLN